MEPIQKKNTCNFYSSTNHHSTIHRILHIHWEPSANEQHITNEMARAEINSMPSTNAFFMKQVWTYIRKTVHNKNPNTPPQKKI